MLGVVKVRFAVSPGIEMWDGDVLPEFIDALESLGFDTIWLSDIPMGAPVDPLVGLAFAAGRTKRLKLGANLVPIGRNPMLLAKQLAQLDRLSSGRLLISLVPGLDQPGERGALGIGDAKRGRLIDDIIPLLRQWWSGAPVDHHENRYDFADVIVRPLPRQDPLEIWLGGIGPLALRRAGRLADGWLGAAITPEEAGIAVAAMRARRPDAPVEQIFPVGGAQLRDLVGQLVDRGLSKFVIRPVGSASAWRDDLNRLADSVLDLQT